jgi:hypothetical protein
LGDGIIGLQSAFAALHLNAIPRPRLFWHPACSPMTRDLLTLAQNFVDLAELPPDLAGSPPEPIPDAFGAAFTQVIDIRDFALDPAFRGVAMIDFFLAKLGLDPSTVPAVLRRNSWLAPSVTATRPVGLPERYILFCPTASMPQRDIPEHIQARLIETMLEIQPLAVVTQGKVTADRVTKSPICTHIAQICGMVAGAAAVISTDTAMVHLADAFARPCLSIFTTHAPEWRVRDYPLNASVRIPVRGLPEALEFVRSDDDLAAIAQGWVEGRGDLEAAVVTFMATYAGQKNAPFFHPA